MGNSGHIVDCRSGVVVKVGDTVRYPDPADSWTLLELKDRLFVAWVRVRNAHGENWIQCPVRWFHPAATEHGHYRVILVPT